MSKEVIELLKSVYSFDNDGAVRQIVWDASKTNDEYTQAMVAITE